MTQDSYMGSLPVPLSENRYIYALDDPMKYVDPTGYIAGSYSYASSISYSTSSEVWDIDEDGFDATETETMTVTFTTVTTCQDDGKCTSTTTASSSTAYVVTITKEGTGQSCSLTQGAEMACAGATDTILPNMSGQQVEAFGVNVFFIGLCGGAGLAGLVCAPGLAGMLYYDYTAGTSATPEGASRNFEYWEAPWDWSSIAHGELEPPIGWILWSPFTLPEGI